MCPVVQNWNSELMKKQEKHTSLIADLKRILCNLSIVFCIAGCSKRVPGANRACVGEQPTRRAAAAAATAANSERPEWERPGWAGSILHPDRRPRCQLVNHQRASLHRIYKNKNRNQQKKLNFLKSRKKRTKCKNVKNKRQQCLLVFFVCVDFLFYKSKTPAHRIDFRWRYSINASNLIRDEALWCLGYPEGKPIIFAFCLIV